MGDSSAFEDVYVSVPHGGPVYVSDMVGPLTSVSEFRSCLEDELKDLRKELCLDLIEQDRHEIAVDELKILSEEDLVDIAFQASLKGDNLTRDSSLSSEECSDGTVDADPACSVKLGRDEDYVPSNNLPKRSKRIGNKLKMNRNVTKKRSKRTGNKPKMNRNVTKKSKRMTQKDTTDEEDYMVEVEKVAEIKQKQEEDKSAARLHSFSGVSGLVACVLPSLEKKEQMLSFNFTNSSTQKVKSSFTREHIPLHGSDILLCIEVYYINRHSTWVKTQEIMVLGQQLLTELRDKLYCLTDEIMKLDAKHDPSGYFLIEDIFYNDSREANARDYSKPILDWLTESKKTALEKWELIISGELQQKQKIFLGSGSGPKLPQLRARPMQATRFCDLHFRLGAGYLYCHQMGCVFGRETLSSGPQSSEIVADKKRERNKDPNVQSGRTENDSTANPDISNNGGQEVQNGVIEKREKDGNVKPRGERRRSKPNPRLSNPTKNLHGEQVAAGWPAWLSAVAGEAINGWVPRRADTFEKINKIGQGTYSNVYKAKDTVTGKIVALKKVRFDNLEPESVKFMAREILILRRLDHPNVVKLEGLVTSRMFCSLYLVFEYMEHDLAGLAASPTIKFTEPQVKCYIHQLLSGLEHCHNHHVLHRDIKGSNLLLDNEGSLKIADFGLASFFDPNHKQPMTSRVVTLWYRPPELLLGATDYGVGIDLWSAGCILAELLAGKPIMPGRTEVEQLHKIFKLCGSPSEEYWKKSKLPHATIFKPQQSYKRCIAETFKHFPPSSLPLIDSLLAIDPAERQTATAALRSGFFTTKPYACDPSSLPKYPPSKEMDAKLRDEEARRLRAAGVKKTRTRERPARAMPALEANAELQVNIDRRRLITHANAKSKSEKFPPPHQDGTLGYPLGSSHHMDPTFDPPDVPFSSNFSYTTKPPIQTWSGPLAEPAPTGRSRRKKHNDSSSKNN